MQNLFNFCLYVHFFFLLIEFLSTDMNDMHHNKIEVRTIPDPLCAFCSAFHRDQFSCIILSTPVAWKFARHVLFRRVNRIRVNPSNSSNRTGGGGDIGVIRTTEDSTYQSNQHSRSDIKKALTRKTYIWRWSEVVSCDFHDVVYLGEQLNVGTQPRPEFSPRCCSQSEGEFSLEH